LEVRFEEGKYFCAKKLEKHIKQANSNKVLLHRCIIWFGINFGFNVFFVQKKTFLCDDFVFNRV